MSNCCHSLKDDFGGERPLGTRRDIPTQFSSIFRHFRSLLPKSRVSFGWHPVRMRSVVLSARLSAIVSHNSVKYQLVLYQLFKFVKLLL